MLLRWFVKFQVWMSQEDGAEFVEYALVGAVLVVGLIFSIKGLRSALITQFQYLTNQVTGTQNLPNQ